MKIKNIILNNYRAFYNEPGEENSKYKIELPNGENLLIYGENGSGKSSIFKGLRDFIQSASQEDLPFQKNIFAEDFELHEEPFVSVTFKDGDSETKLFYSSDFARTNTNKDFLKNAHKSRSFMSYRELMKIHFIDKDRVNLFDFLFEEHGLLYEIENPVSRVSETKISLGALWKKLGQDPDETLLHDFNDGLSAKLTELTAYLNKLLHYFDSNLNVTLSFKPITMNQARAKQCEVTLDVVYCGKNIDGYHLFLNEARLTAIAISIYLGVHLSVPKGDFEVLFLDDVFTGLDTSNRLPLLQILSDPKIGGGDQDTLVNHQIFLTTYDRHWFTLARQHLGDTKWKAVELFVGEGPQLSARPVLINSVGNDYYSKARSYFEAKDYPACANYQRKECERLIKMFLPDNYKYTKDEDGNIKPVDSLGSLTDNLKKYFAELALDFSAFRDFKNYTKVVMNPLSHDDLKSPAYRMEIERVFKIIDELRKLKAVTKLKAGRKLKLSKEHPHNKFVYEYEFELRADVRLIQYGRTEKYTPIILLPLTLKAPTATTKVKYLSQEGNAEKVWSQVCHYLGIDSQSDNFLDNFYIQQEGTRTVLRNLLSV